MEETNYDRAPLELVSTPNDTSGMTTPKEEVLSTSSDPEKTAAITKSGSDTDHATAAIHYKPKTYLQKLALLDKKRDFRLFRMMIRPLLFLSLPSVVYAGFSYGSNLVWFNVLNGTASLSMFSCEVLTNFCDATEFQPFSSLEGSWKSKLLFTLIYLARLTNC